MIMGAKFSAHTELYPVAADVGSLRKGCEQRSEVSSPKAASAKRRGRRSPARLCGGCRTSRTELPCDPQSRFWVSAQRRTEHPLGRCLHRGAPSMVYSSPGMGATRGPSTDEGMKSWCIHTAEQDSAAAKSNTSPLATTRMRLEGPVLSELSQTETDKHHQMWNLNNQNKWANKTEMDPQEQRASSRRRKVRRRRLLTE